MSSFSKAIAMKCWYDAGPATGRARQLLTWWRASLGDTSLQAYEFPTDACTPGDALRFENASTPPNVLEEVPEDFTLFPNPANNMVIIRYEGVREGTLDFILLDASGKTVVTQEISLNAGGVGVTTKHLPAGMYFGVLRQGTELIGTKRLAIYR
jgi:hypothetical protein